MQMFWLRSHARRPGGLGNIPEPDRQVMLPLWWCERCGMEVDEVDLVGSGRLWGAWQRQRIVEYDAYEAERMDPSLRDL